MIDLHIHTNYSGGKKDLSQILQTAKERTNALNKNLFINIILTSI